MEEICSDEQVQLRTRPIRGHVFCSFLALVLQMELADHCQSHEVTVDWNDLIRDLERLQEAIIEKDGKCVTTRAYVE